MTWKNGLQNSCLPTIATYLIYIPYLNGSGERRRPMPDSGVRILISIRYDDRPHQTVECHPAFWCYSLPPDLRAVLPISISLPIAISQQPPYVAHCRDWPINACSSLWFFTWRVGFWCNVRMAWPVMALLRHLQSYLALLSMRLLLFHRQWVPLCSDSGCRYVLCVCDQLDLDRKSVV